VVKATNIDYNNLHTRNVKTGMVFLQQMEKTHPKKLWHGLPAANGQNTSKKITT
jgi:hypothetical protein